MFRGFILLFITVCFLSACNYSIQKTPFSLVPSNSNYSQSELSFAAVYNKVLRPNCIGCHGNSGGINLESYTAVKTRIDKVRESVIAKRSMPKSPTPALDQDQLGLLNAWIERGAPEFGTGPSEPPLPSLEPTFESIKTHILEAKCIACHAPGKPVARIPLVSKQDLLNSPLDIVIPGNADESGLILVVTGAIEDKLMPPLKDQQGNPTGFSLLSETEIQVLRDWINAGASN
ncbi:hypothetical protein DOM22_05600 [Bdellovibrio sp. ZAP7]|uniref:c-type cytochrome domain-containing protein n=1 Tax=Bdellovibrio sp. ZAP7 TaxID=2231053 RepID=UPI001157488E|nr:c-type cytochrome domain-containing protein [Bdellovibrio sp. ZAP7]QDK44672.1 hypothetical protein DOM22_05600 [Bdellovibrio sp. ZAP7]